jgi:glycine/D-amino acid oxidase-like deaminating enzyme
MKCDFNTLVIGKGLIGSATAKYLSVTDNSIAVIGPDEPGNLSESFVFASHYDQARVQRIIGKDEVWTRLNLISTQHYEEIQNTSGIQFHNPVGCLYVNPYGEDTYLKGVPGQCVSYNQSVKKYYSGVEINADFNEFQFPVESHGILESAPSGLINPRMLIKAQLAIFLKNKGQILNETVLDVSFQQNKFVILTRNGNQYTASRVVVAAGSFINYLNLVPQKLKLITKSEVVLLAKISPDVADALSKLPSLLYEIDTDEVEGIYLIQPVKYPDGHFYIKMGCNMPEDILFDSLEQIQSWFWDTQTYKHIGRLLNALNTIMPTLSITNYQTKKCIISRTPHGRPFIGESTQKGLYISGGCNGYSAMCSDAIGYVTAHLVTKGHIPSEFPLQAFELIYQNN